MIQAESRKNSAFEAAPIPNVWIDIRAVLSDGKNQAFINRRGYDFGSAMDIP